MGCVSALFFDVDLLLAGLISLEKWQLTQLEPVKELSFRSIKDI